MAADSEFHHDSISYFIFSVIGLSVICSYVWIDRLFGIGNMDERALETIKFKIKLNGNVGQFRNEINCQIRRNDSIELKSAKTKICRPFLRCSSFILHTSTCFEVHQMFVSHRFISIKCSAVYSRPIDLHLLKFIKTNAKFHQLLFLF